MAGFTMFEYSQVRARKDWWENQSKKMPLGPGVRSRFEIMLKALGAYNKDPAPETAQKASGTVLDLIMHLEKLPLIKVHPKKYEFLFKSLKSTHTDIEKHEGQLKSMAETKRDLKATAAGKGVDANKAGDEKGW